MNGGGQYRVFSCRRCPLQLHPHLACGLRGESFPTPFADPRGKGPSAPIVNFLRGAFDLPVGVYLISRHPVAVDFSQGFVALVFGVLTIGIYLSLHFGKVRQPRKLNKRTE